MAHVNAVAIQAGIRDLQATEAERIGIHVASFFKNRRHPDSENVRKGVIDALFYGAKFGDKYVWGMDCGASYGPDPRVVVTVVWGPYCAR